MKPYYSDDLVTLYHGDCLDITEWLDADVLVTDPPYGVAWRRHGGGSRANGRSRQRHAGIANDDDTSVRDGILAAWGDRPAVVFGSFYAPPPDGVCHVGVYLRSRNAGVLGSTIGLRRDVEAIFFCGGWPARPASRSSLFATRSVAGSPTSPQAMWGHPHAKPEDVLEPLLGVCPPGVVADPCAGSGATLVAARNVGRRAVGVELEERHCETIARRLSQGVLRWGVVA